MSFLSLLPSTIFALVLLEGLVVAVAVDLRICCTRNIRSIRSLSKGAEKDRSLVLVGSNSSLLLFDFELLSVEVA